MRERILQQKNIFALAFALASMLMSSPVDAVMTSSQYSLESYSVGGGGQGTTLSSSEYSLKSSTQDAKQYTTATPASGNGGTQGSRSTIVSQILDTESEFIGEQIQYEDIATVDYAEVAPTYVSEFLENKQNAVEEKSERKEQNIFNVLNISKEVDVEYGNPRGLSASVIEAIRGEHASFGEMMRAFFAERSARAGVLITVLSVLWYVRTFTVIGIKYRPF